MNTREVSEIRRRFRAERSNIGAVRGVFVNEKREIVTEFDQSFGVLPEEETGAILSTFKKTLSGHLGKNLIDVPFSTAQVADSDEHRLLSALRDSALRDDEAVRTFFRKAAEAIDVEGSYLLMLACDAYDVFRKTSDGERKEESSDTFRYVVCCVCPIKSAPSALTYVTHENRFRSFTESGIVGAPAFGFMFPAFDDRVANIYNALYYTHDLSDSHTAFTDAIFHTPLPLPAAVQKATFGEILRETVDEECSLRVVEKVQNEIRGIIETNKENRMQDDPIPLSEGTVRSVLSSAGVSEEKVAAFTEKFEEAFGKHAELPPVNFVATGATEVRTPEVVIKVDPEHTDLIETRVVGGAKYVMIRADGEITVNGVKITIAE